MKKVVYAGSFDPITNGHVWVIERVIELFDEVVIAIGINPDKKYMFNINERLDMLKEITNKYVKVKIDTFENKYLIKYAQEIKTNYIIRGIRSQIDFEYEKQMCNVNRGFNPCIETIFLIPPVNVVDISSSFVKGLVGPEGWERIIGLYVPKIVEKYLIERYKK
jgi:pantetheine-phosphate adenylyltransferase/8-oxo-dGTP diphosphatase